MIGEDGDLFSSKLRTTQIKQIFGNKDTWTPNTNVSAGNHSLEIKTTNNIANHIEKGVNVFLLERTDELPNYTGDYITDNQTAAKYSAMCIAYLNVYGYMSI